MPMQGANGGNSDNLNFDFSNSLSNFYSNYSGRNLRASTATDRDRDRVSGGTNSNGASAAVLSLLGRPGMSLKRSASDSDSTAEAKSPSRASPASAFATATANPFAGVATDTGSGSGSGRSPKRRNMGSMGSMGSSMTRNLNLNLNLNTHMGLHRNRNMNMNLSNSALVNANTLTMGMHANSSFHSQAQAQAQAVGSAGAATAGLLDSLRLESTLRAATASNAAGAANANTHTHAPTNTNANLNLMAGFDSEAQHALLAASRLRQAQAHHGLQSLAFPSPYASLLPSFPTFSSLANFSSPGFTMDAQLRAAQLMALQSQFNRVDPTQMILAEAQHRQNSIIHRDFDTHADPSPQPPTSADNSYSTATSTTQSKVRSTSASVQTQPFQDTPPSPPAPPAAPAPSSSSNNNKKTKKDPPKETLLAVPGAIPPPIPPAVEGSTPHYSQRADSIISMATDEDQNWLSEFQCFIRSEILEIFRASAEDVQIRNNSKTLQTQQIGIRCRFCAHLPPSSRASRSSAFPSSIPQIYQSFTMMLRDHWTACQSIPSPQKQKFLEFKTKNNQGASDSKNYWMHAARRTGMINTPKGIQIDDASRQAAARIPPFGTNSDTKASLMLEREDTAPLVLPEDKLLLKDNMYWYVLMEQVQRVRLSESERVGNRKSLRIGLPGFGCRYCCQAGRLGLSRIFPARRRTLPAKIPDIHDHLRRCPLCPQHVKDQLDELAQQRSEQQKQEAEGKSSGGYSAGKEKEFFTRIWSRLGHGNKPEPS